MHAISYCKFPLEVYASLQDNTQGNVVVNLAVRLEIWRSVVQGLISTIMLFP